MGQNRIRLDRGYTYVYMSQGRLCIFRHSAVTVLLKVSVPPSAQELWDGCRKFYGLKKVNHLCILLVAVLVLPVAQLLSSPVSNRLEMRSTLTDLFCFPAGRC